MNGFRILELFSGVGGMHYAFRYSELDGAVVAAVDINTVANAVYSHNYPNTNILNNNIQKLTPKTIERLNANMILMSPPCQPFTRVGNQKDIGDSRTDALKHICDILPKCDSIEFILMENVKGFENSKAREIFVNTLQQSNFFYREFLLTPSQLGVPNSRLRYYCLARKKKDFDFESALWEHFPRCNLINKFKVEDILDPSEYVPNALLLNDKVLKKRIWLFDIVSPESTRTNCFTKAYTYYSEGTGSIFTPLSRKEMMDIFEEAKILDPTTDNYLKCLRSLRLRYFTPREVSLLMSFPNDFQFPGEITLRQRYRLLGNSINVMVVGELIKILCS